MWAGGTNRPRLEPIELLDEFVTVTPRPEVNRILYTTPLGVPEFR